MTTGVAAREEPGRYYTFQSRLPAGTFFEIRPRLLPHNAQPILIGLSARNLKMTETSAKHMHNPGRYVPLQLQEKAIRYGRRRPDPQKIRVFSL